MKFALRWPFVRDAEQQANNEDLLAAVNTLGQFEFVGNGTPEGNVTANVGSTYRRRNGGASTSFYVKESGTGNTGWVGK